MEAEWEAKGWEAVAWDHGDSRVGVTFRKPRGGGRAAAWVVVALVTALVITTTGIFARNYFSEVRSDARAAVRALKARDLAGNAEYLAAYRGDPEFAYLFASKVTPRAIGDALGTVAGTSRDEPLIRGIDAHAYEVILTDLAGTLALATHGRAEHALPESWTNDFVTAATTPLELYGGADGFFDREGKRRERQDLANRANLLLVLSRGYWSTEFLQAVTRGFYEHDVREGERAWPEADPGKNVKFAPAPNGVYLTDGILALSAALTANPAASEWAFTDFLPGNQTIADSDHSIGRFAHFLLFEHRFPESRDGESVGVTAVLTALTAAIDSSTWASGPVDSQAVNFALTETGPLHDAAVLQVLAEQITEGSGCSWDPRDYWDCTKEGAGAVWQWIQRWGRTVLVILSEVPGLVGTVATATDAAWSAIEGDYEEAGLSLAGAIAGGDFGKITGSVKTGVAAHRAASEAAHVAKVSRQIQAGADPAMNRVALNLRTRTAIEAQAPMDSQGRYLDPGTGLPIVGEPRIDYKPGYEWACTQAKARVEGWTKEQLTEYANDPNHYQLVDSTSSRSRAPEAVPCAP